MKVLFRFLLIFIFVFVSIASTLAIREWDQFELVQDKRNYKESKGGKGVPPQGCILDDSEQFLLINGDKLKQAPQPTDKEWRYVVTMNCKRGGRAPKEMVEAIATKLIPPSERHRLAFILGINERASVASYGTPLPSWDSMGIDLATFQAYNIPILITYFQWTSFWQKKDASPSSASQIRKEMYEKVKSIRNARQKETALESIEKLEKQHQYPFGATRTFLLQNSQAEAFVTSFAQGQDVYIHIQDSDFMNLQEELMFGDFQGEKPLVAVNDNYLFARYDALITNHRTHHTQPPMIVGGAHVYSPEEELEDVYLKTLSPSKQKEKLNSVSAKQATRFASEMGNNLKHIMGLYQPYGLYFHEPNTLILSPVSANRRMAQAVGEFKTVYTRLAHGFHFGIDSEVQEFTRALFHGMTDDTCRTGMLFSSTTVLSTSMVRGKKPFTIRHAGTFDEETQTFQHSRKTDLGAFRGMSQEIIHPNKWGSNLSTSFAAHRVHDARTQLYQLFSYFDPLERLDPSNTESYRSALIIYDQYLEEKKEEIRTLSRTLQEKYNARNQGKEVAFQLVSIAWESGQMMRLMLLDHFSSPAEIKIDPSTFDKIRETREFLTQRFNFVWEKGSSLPVVNPFVRDLLGEDPIIKVEDTVPEAVREFAPTSLQVGKIVAWFLKKEGNVKARTARTLGIGTTKTLDNLIANTAPKSWQQIAGKVKTTDLIAQNFPTLSVTERQELFSLLQA